MALFVLLQGPRRQKSEGVRHKTDLSMFLCCRRWECAAQKFPLSLVTGTRSKAHENHWEPFQGLWSRAYISLCCLKGLPREADLRSCPSSRLPALLCHVEGLLQVPTQCHMQHQPPVTPTRNLLMGSCANTLPPGRGFQGPEIKQPENASCWGPSQFFWDRGRQFSLLRANESVTRKFPNGRTLRVS